MSTKNNYRTRHIYTLAAHATFGEVDKQTSRRLTSATCTTVHAIFYREIYIINFAYITITITSYARHFDRTIRGDFPATIHYILSSRKFSKSTLWVSQFFLVRTVAFHWNHWSNFRSQCRASSSVMLRLRQVSGFRVLSRRSGLSIGVPGGFRLDANLS